jgi:hypothetical protein
MTFAAAVNAHLNRPTVARTDNGMKAHKNTGSAVLDLFTNIGTARNKDITHLFMAALAEDTDLTLRTLLYARDIRAGSGERQTFRNLLTKLEAKDSVLASKLMHKIPELGRWDDMFTFTGENRLAAFEMIRKALIENKNGLAAKWMPRKGPIAVELTKFLGLSPKAYRKLIVGLTQVVETQMCSKNWNEINFSHVPSVASARYQKAFGRNAKEAYSAYLAELQKPEAERTVKVKINAGAVFPYDVVKSTATGNAAVADEQWKALPNYIGDAKIFPMIDVSSSMGYFSSCRNMQPIDLAVSLGLYVSEKGTSAFKDMFVTFDSKPQIVKVKGTLSERLNQVAKSPWGGSTNLAAAFDLILNIARKGNVAEADMPEVMVIFSDMQFDPYHGFDATARQMITDKYNRAGYNLPRVVFWNLRADAGNTPVKFSDTGVAMVSGYSPATIKAVLANDLDDFTPYNVMLKTIMNDRYAY